MGKKIVGTTGIILDEAKKLRPDEVIFTIPIGKREELWGLINLFQKEKVDIRIVPDIYEFLSSRMVMDDLEGVPTIRFRPIAQEGVRGRHCAALEGPRANV